MTDSLVGCLMAALAFLGVAVVFSDEGLITKLAAAAIALLSAHWFALVFVR